MSKYIDEILTVKTPQNNRAISKIILKHFHEKIAGILMRYNSLAESQIKTHKYNTLLMEARELYFQEFYYSCVVMSCSIAEYILRDLFFANIYINMLHPSNKTQKYLSFIQAKTICECLVSESVIQKHLLPSFKILGELHSQYSNITPKFPKEAAKRALYHLHKILNQLDLHQPTIPQ